MKNVVTNIHLKRHHKQALQAILLVLIVLQAVTIHASLHVHE